jgi:Arc/MetJ family transcription regulator
MSTAPRNQHVHPLFRDLLNSFADTQLADAQAADERSAQLKREQLAEWRADDAEAMREEREPRGRWA